MRVNVSRGVLTALLGIVVLSCNDGPTAPKPFGARALTDGVPVPPIVISQVYGGGGNSGATVKNDFVELFNPGTSPVNVTGWSVQYMSAGGTATATSPSGFVALSGTIQPGAYYLVQEAAGAGGTVNLPTPDAIGVAAMSATAGKVFLTSSSTVLSAACPTTAVVDQVSFGSGTTCGSTTAATANATAALRKGAGCTYSGLSSADFVIGAPTPRNSASPTTTCTGGGAQPATVTVAPSASTAVVGSTQSFTASAFDNATPPNPVSTTFTWTSDNTAVATVDAAGVATAKTVGTANISATSANGKVGSAALSVVAVPPGDVVISQVYGGGGNSGAQYTNDYVELFNRGTVPTPITGWTVQYTSATGTTWAATTLPAGSIAPGKYYLVQMAGGSVGDPLPTPEATGSSAMSATAGKVLLALPGANPTGACPSGGGIIDHVAYGSGTNCALPADWNGATPTLSNTTAAFRNTSGCAKTGNVTADFSVSAPAPRNSGAPSFICPTPPGPLDHIAISGGTTVSIGATVTLSAELQDVANQKITDAAATYTWQSADEATVHLVSTTANTATFKGMQLGGPITITVTATSNGLTRGPTTAPTLTVNGSATIVPSTTLVSELHYDNAGVDVSEGIEIEGDAGSSLDGWSLVLYDGNGGVPYNTTALSGAFPSTCGARGVIVVNFPNTEFGTIQNGPSATNSFGDGWALVNNLGQVTEFKSYEGTFAATGGPAGGLTSTAIEADETTPPPASPRRSVQRAGNGIWFGPTLATFGACNPAIPPAPTGTITLTSGKTELAFAMQTQFFFGGVDKSGHTPTSVVWSTSNSSIITVDQKGIVTATGLGTAKLIATAPDDATGSIDMVVYLSEGSTTARYGHNVEFGTPTDADPNDEILIARQQYTVSYNPSRGGANWVSWNLDATHIGDNGRCPGTCYSADTALTKAGITAYTTADWVSGNTWDRGHMAPSADWTSSEADNNTTFFLSNFLPQKHELNAGPWEVLENALRDSVSVSHGSREAYIIAGGIFTNGVGLGTILNLGKIAIPDSTWKIAVITPAGTGLNNDGTLPPNSTVMAVNMPNVTNPSSDWHTYLTTVAKIQRSTGYNFLSLITPSVQCQVEGNCAPTARITSDLIGGSTIFGQLVTFSGSTSSDPDEGDALSMAWSVDGSAAVSGTTFNYRFPAVGQYHVRLTVKDNFGLTNSVETVVNVGPRPTPSCGLGRFENAADFYNCDPAPAGYFVADEHATSPTPCAVGYFQPTPGQSSCLPAPIGTYVGAPASIAATPCAVGFYQDETAAASCKPAPAGKYVSTTGAAAATNCPIGFYQDAEGSAACKPAPAGSSVGTMGAAAATPCAPGSFQALAGQAMCNPAPLGFFVASPGATEATPCAAGFYQDHAAATSCIPAPAGKFVPVSGASAATDCAAGFYQSLTGATSCIPAPAGSFVATEGAADATPCAPGTFQPATGATSCLPAPAGSFVSGAGAVSATLCVPGTYQSATGSTACVPSTPGHYVGTFGAAAQTPCAPGTYQSLPGTTSCVSAPAGSYVATTGAAAATPCPLGSYQPSGASTSCILAPIASYVAITGAIAATSCPVGMTTNSVGTTSAAGCVWLPPASLTQLAADQLQQLVAGGQISSDDANPINVSIDQALKSIEKGNLTPARNQLGAAVNKVQAAVRSGKISSADAASLIAALNLAIAHM